MSVRHVIVAALAVLTLSGPSRADQLQPIEGRSFSLGALSGVAYYTVEDDGYHVVVTVAQGEAGIPMRFESVLIAGQSLILSMPREEGTAPIAIEIRREGDELHVINTPAQI